MLKQKRSTLPSISFGKMLGTSELPKEVLSLFTELVETPSKKTDYASIIIANALNGKINFNKDFSIGKYEWKIKQNQAKHQITDLKSRVYIDIYDTDTEDKKDTSKFTTIPMSDVSVHMVDKMKDAFEELESDSELASAIASIKELQSFIFIEEGVNLLGVINRALEECTEAKDILKSICEKYTDLAEQIYIVLSSGKSFEECFA